MGNFGTVPFWNYITSKLVITSAYRLWSNIMTTFENTTRLKPVVWYDNHRNKWIIKKKRIVCNFIFCGFFIPAKYRRKRTTTELTRFTILLSLWKNASWVKQITFEKKIGVLKYTFKRNWLFFLSIPRGPSIVLMKYT